MCREPGWCREPANPLTGQEVGGNGLVGALEGRSPGVATGCEGDEMFRLGLSSSAYGPREAAQ